MSDVAGIFVGGAASRMSGRAKGLLAAPGGLTIVERWGETLRGVGFGVILVGEASAYAHLGLETFADETTGIGPLGGLIALLRRAGRARCLALACDMPFVSRGLVERLCGTPAEGPILAPKRAPAMVWEPLFARYDAPRVLPLAIAQAQQGEHSLQRLLDRAGASTLALSAEESAELDDWDSPGDMATRAESTPKGHTPSAE